MDQIVTPRKCIQVVDKVDKEPESTVDFRLDPQNKTNIVFEFEIQMIDGCSDEYKNKLHERVVIETQPPIPREILD